jgi:hypothetical protein
MGKLFKTAAEKSEKTAREGLVKQYENEVLRPAAGGKIRLEDAEADFNERHREVLVKIFGAKGAPAVETDPFEVG